MIAIIVVDCNLHRMHVDVGLQATRKAGGWMNDDGRQNTQACQETAPVFSPPRSGFNTRQGVWLRAFYSFADPGGL